jgi:hypothetical protein
MRTIPFHAIPIKWTYIFLLLPEEYLVALNIRLFFREIRGLNLDEICIQFSCLHIKT